jgi:outer membrane protein assembly factor BamB
LWATPVGGAVTGLQSDGGSVLGVSLGQTARVFSLDADTGAVRWSYDSGPGTSAHFPVIPDLVADHEQAFGDFNGDGVTDVAVGVFTGCDLTDPTQSPATCERFASAEGRQWEVIALDGSSGNVLWGTFPSVQTRPELSEVGTNVAVVGVQEPSDYGDVDFELGQVDGSHQVPQVALLDGTTGRETWAAPLPKPPAVDGRVFDLGNGLLAVALDGTTVDALNASNGTSAWVTKLDVHDEVEGQHDDFLVSTGGCVIDFVNSADEAFVVQGDGNVRTVDLSQLPAPTAVAVAPGSGIVYATSHGDFLIDPAALLSGQVRVLGSFHLPPSVMLAGGVAASMELPVAGGLSVAPTSAGEAVMGFSAPSGGGVGGAWGLVFPSPTSA